MEFVEITPILKNNYPFLPFIIWFFVSLLAWGVGCFYASTKETTKESRKILDISSAICWGSVILCLITLFIIDSYSEKVPTGRNRYTAIVDDSADYKEIVEKYNIIESHGKIWVLEDKDGNS